MYGTGVATWALSRWFFIQGTLGPEVSPLRLWWLQIHSIVSLWFMILFGYLYHSHVLPAWRKHHGPKRFNGAWLTGGFIVLILTVPGLFYLNNESAKAKVAWLHTYLGLSIAMFFVLHWRTKATRKKRR